MPQITGSVDSISTAGTLIVQRQGDFVQQSFPIIKGAIALYLEPGKYSIQRLYLNQQGLIPCENWNVPDVPELTVRDIRFGLTSHSSLLTSHLIAPPESFLNIDLGNLSFPETSRANALTVTRSLDTGTAMTNDMLVATLDPFYIRNFGTELLYVEHKNPNGIPAVLMMQPSKQVNGLPLAQRFITIYPGTRVVAGSFSPDIYNVDGVDGPLLKFAIAGADVPNGFIRLGAFSTTTGSSKSPYKPAPAIVLPYGPVAAQRSSFSNPRNSQYIGII